MKNEPTSQSISESLMGGIKRMTEEMYPGSTAGVKELYDRVTHRDNVFLVLYSASNVNNKLKLLKKHRDRACNLLIKKAKDVPTLR